MQFRPTCVCFAACSAKLVMPCSWLKSCFGILGCIWYRSHTYITIHEHIILYNIYNISIYNFIYVWQNEMFPTKSSKLGFLGSLLPYLQPKQVMVSTRVMLLRPCRLHGCLPWGQCGCCACCQSGTFLGRCMVWDAEVDHFLLMVTTIMHHLIHLVFGNFIIVLGKYLVNHNMDPQSLR